MTSRVLRQAHKLAKTSGHHRHRMAALLLRGGAVVSAEANGAAGRGHAEARALRPHLDARGTHLVVVRLNGNGSSRPCAECTTKIQSSGVARVSFVDVDGVWRTLPPEEL